MQTSKILRYSVAEGYEVKPPKQKTPGSAGIDLHIPKFTLAFVKDFEKINEKVFCNEDEKDIAYLTTGRILILPAHSRCIVPSGLYFDVPEGWMLEGANRGSVSSIQGIVHGAHIIDRDYQGMVFMSIINTGNTSAYLKEDSALLQVLLREAPASTLVEVPFNELYAEVTERGAGALGSTDGK